MAIDIDMLIGLPDKVILPILYGNVEYNQVLQNSSISPAAMCHHQRPAIIK